MNVNVAYMGLYLTLETTTMCANYHAAAFALSVSSQVML